MTTATLTSAGVRTYQVDKSHSELTFQVRHLLTRVRGRFTAFSGAVEFDAADPTRSSVRLTIDAASVDTDEPTRDNHLRSADFFSAAEFPALTFVSKSLARVGGDAYEAAGDLTIRGITREVVVPVTFLGEARDPWGGDRLFFEGSVTLNRKDYGLHWNAALETGGFLVGDEVRISFAIEAIGQ